MTTRTTRDTEREIAILLAGVLDDVPFWDMYAEPPDDAGWRDRIAERAIILYDQTAPIVEAHATAPIEPVDRGAAMVREMADACAILSHPWGVERRLLASIPSRALIESGIRAYGVDAWAASLGVALNLTTDGGVNEAWAAEEERQSDHLTEADLAESFAHLARSYGTVLAAREIAEGHETLASFQARQGACELVGLARGWLIWARGQSDNEAEAVAAMQLLLVQGWFIATRETSTDRELFPSKPFLRRVLRAVGGDQWLRSHNVELPDWLD